MLAITHDEEANTLVMDDPQMGGCRRLWKRLAPRSTDATQIEVFVMPALISLDLEAGSLTCGREVNQRVAKRRVWRSSINFCSVSSRCSSIKRCNMASVALVLASSSFFWRKYCFFARRPIKTIQPMPIPAAIHGIAIGFICQTPSKFQYTAWPCQPKITLKRPASLVDSHRSYPTDQTPQTGHLHLEPLLPRVGGAACRSRLNVLHPIGSGCKRKSYQGSLGRLFLKCQRVTMTICRKVSRNKLPAVLVNREQLRSGSEIPTFRILR